MRDSLEWIWDKEVYMVGQTTLIHFYLDIHLDDFYYAK